MNKKIITALTALLMFSSVFGLISAIPVASASPPASSASNTSYLNTSVTYWHAVDLANSSTTTVTLPNNVNSSATPFFYSAGSSTSTAWTAAGGNDYLNISTPSFYFSEGASMHFYFVFPSPDEVVSGRSADYNIGTVSMKAVTSGGSSLATSVPSYNFSYESGTSFYVEVSLTIPALSYSYAGSAIIQLEATPDSGYAINGNDPGSSYTLSSASNSIVSSEPSSGSTPLAYGWTFGSATSTISHSSDLLSYNIVTENPSASTTVSYNGASGSVPYTFTGSLSQFSIKFSPNADPPLGAAGTTDSNSLTWNVYYYLSSQVQAQKTSTTQSYSSSQDPSELQNWWNSSSSFTLTPPSGALNNPSLSTTSGTVNAETTMTWSINHILSVGYGQSPAFDRIFYSGSDITSSSVAPSAQYISISRGSDVVIDSSTGVSYNFDEFINYDPSIVNSHLVSSVNPLTPVNIYGNATEVISGELQNIALSPNGKPYIYSSPTSSESLVSPSFDFHSTGQKIIDWYVHNGRMVVDELIEIV